MLVVIFHGATQRHKYTLPRFERVRTLTGLEYSSMHFSDPALHMGERLSLAWYTGWAELDLYPLIAEWIRKAAMAVGASHIVLSGSSGGGFASLQVASFLPGSLALPASPQTAIANYFNNGKRHAQRQYVRLVMPHIPEPDLEPAEGDRDWSLPLGVRASAVRRYSLPQPNRVLYVQNINDAAHVQDHYRPFRSAVESWASDNEVRFWEYDGPFAHNPPDQRTFLESLRQGVDWLRDAP